MEFKFNSAAECLDIKLEKLTGDSSVEIKYIKFDESAKKYIEDIFKNGLNNSNQNLVINQILLSKENYLSLENCNYKASFRTLANLGEEGVQAIEFTLSSISLNFEMKDVSFEGNEVKIHCAEITVYYSEDNSVMEL